jgi:hypothetical protein
MTFVPLTSSRPQPLSQNAIPIVASFSLTINQPLQAKEPQVDSLELSLKNRKKRTHTTNLNAKMSYGINTAPSIDSHMLVQLLLCIGLPFLILPFLATTAYLAFRWYKARKTSLLSMTSRRAILSQTQSARTPTMPVLSHNI